MFLTRHNVTFYLLDSMLLTRSDIVRNSVRVTDQSARNRNFFVRTESEGFFVKQASTPAGNSGLHREAQCYRIANHHGSLRHHLPRHLHDSEKNGIVVTSLLPRERLRPPWFIERHEIGPTSHAMGNALAVCHENFRNETEKFHGRATLPGQLPWLLRPETLSPQRKHWSLGQQALCRVAARFPMINRYLLELAEEWNWHDLIHGDVKLDNCVVARSSSCAPQQITWIDWELVDLGDRAWDIGGIIQSWIACWIFFFGRRLVSSSADQSSADPQDFLRTVNLAIPAFWSGYAAGIAAATGDLLHRSIRFAGARIIQTAYEYLCRSTRCNRTSLMLLQAGLNLMKSPDRYIHDTFSSH